MYCIMYCRFMRCLLCNVKWNGWQRHWLAFIRPRNSNTEPLNTLEMSLICIYNLKFHHNPCPNSTTGPTSTTGGCHCQGGQGFQGCQGCSASSGAALAAACGVTRTHCEVLKLYTHSQGFRHSFCVSVQCTNWLAAPLASI